MFRIHTLLAVLISAALSVPAAASQPVIKVVPSNAKDARIPHGVLSQKATTLKAITDSEGADVQATWDPGDGSSPLVSLVTDRYDVSASHVYSGLPGKTFDATLTVTNTRTGEWSAAVYHVVILAKTLAAEATAATDEGLWYLHLNLHRTSLGLYDGGGWTGACANVCDETGSVNAANLLAFERNGFVPSGDSANPYTETTSRALNTVLNGSATLSLRNADWVEALQAANQPQAVATLGPPDMAGHTYQQIVDGYVETGSSSQFGLSLRKTNLQDAQTMVNVSRARRGLASVTTADGEAATARIVIDRQDPAGFWTGNNPPAAAALETAQSLFLLSSFATSSGPSQISNVSGQVSVTTSGYLYSRAQRTYGGTITVTNTSASTISGPIDVVLTHLTAGVSLVNSDGSYNGDPYRVATGVSSLGPGQQVTIVVTFSNPQNARIDFTPVTYSGTFPPAAVSVGCPSSSGTNGTNYSSALMGAGGILPYTYSISNGSLPGGLNLDAASGSVTGTPNANGTFAFTTNLSDGSGQPSGTASASCSITISPATTPVTLSCPANTAQVGVSYSSALAANGGTGPYTYSITLGALPTPLTLNGATGAITGTPNTQGTSTFTAKVTDSTTGTPQTSMANCAIAVSPASTVQVTVQTSPAGRSFSVDGTTYTSTQSFNWVPASSHTIATTSPQTAAGTQYVFNNWSDGGALSHSVTGPSSATIYTASFDTQYQLTTAASPSAGGTVTPASGGYFAANSVQTVTATANAGYVFANWTGPVADSTSASTTVTLTGPVSVTANFNSLSAITVGTSPAGESFTVDGTTYTTTQVFNWVPGSSHSLATTSPQGSGGTRFLFNNWSDGGAISHTVTAPASAASYTANFDTQYQLTTAASPANGGSVTPTSGSFFPAGSVQAVSATPAAGFAFNGWTGPVQNATSASTTVTLTGPTTITANFVTALSVSCPATTTDFIGTAYSSSITASGGRSSYTFSIFSGSLPPTLTLNTATGLISGTPTTKGTYNFVAKAVDSTSPIQQSATASCTITVPNRAPTATGQSVSTNEDTAKTITLAGTDPDGDTLSFTVVTNPAHGTLSNFGAVSCSGTPSNCTRAVTYTPAANYNGSDSFTFKVNDGTVDSASNATVSITIAAVNDPPNALAKAYTAMANMQIQVPAASGLLIGATDPDSGDAGFTLVLKVGTVSATTPAGGTVTFDQNTGAFTFDAPAGFTGNMSFTYTVCDNGNPLPSMCSTPAIVTMTVTGPVIYFVNSAASTNGTGTLSSPFNSLASANTVLGTNTNQRIFLYSGTYGSGVGVTLSASDWLVGQGATGTSFDSLMAISPPPGTIARPSINGTAPIVQGQVSMNGSNTEVLGLSIQPPSGTAGLVATQAGPFTGLVVSNIPVVSTANARAVDLRNVTGSFALTKVSASSADIGINLSAVNVASGSFAVAGTGGNCRANDTTCSGGTITNSTNIGVQLANANNVSLSNLRINKSTHFGLLGTTIAGLSLNTCLMDGTTGTTSQEGQLYASNWTGTGAIANCEILSSSGNNVQVQNTQGQLNRLTVSNSIIRDNDHTTLGNTGFDFEAPIPTANGGAGVVMNLTVTGTLFQHHRADHLHTTAQGLSTMDLVFSNNTLVGGESGTLGDTVTISEADGANVTFDFNGNTSNGALLSAFTFFQANTSTAQASMVGKFRNNHVGTTGVAGSGSAQADGLAVTATGLGTVTINVTGNTIRQYSEYGINMAAGDTSPHLNATVTGNTVKEPNSANAFQGVIFNAGTTSTGSVTGCVDINSNDAVGSGGNGFSDLRVRQRFTSSVRVPGFAGTTATDLANYLMSRNSPTPSATASIATSVQGGAACTQAP